MNIKDNFMCCGCQACVQVCPHNAITMKEDYEGFLYPLFNDVNCIDCSLCYQVCPVINTDKILNDRGDAYAVQSKDLESLKKSSSGGFFSIIAQNIIEKGGVVVGASLNDTLEVKHIIVERQADLFKLRGSKYVQSDTSDIFLKVKEKLNEECLVLFTGTPCQCAALKLFLKKNYDNLIIADILCHGVPSQKMFSRCVKYIEEEYNAIVLDYQFRDKTMLGWSRVSACKIKKSDGSIKNIYYNPYLQAYFASFLKGDVLRRDCYNCRFCRTERSGDLTLADFWSLNKSNPHFPNRNLGVSLVTINSGKGKMLLNQCSGEAVIQKADWNGILDGNNYQLRYPTPLNSYRQDNFDLFFNSPTFFIKRYLGDNENRVRMRFYILSCKRTVKLIINKLVNKEIFIIE